MARKQNSAPVGCAPGMKHQWELIRDALKQEIAAGNPPVGALLPTEAALAKRFDVNRHTVRRGIAALRKCGLVQSRQGSGVRVLRKPAVYRIGRRTRFSENLSAPSGGIGTTIVELYTRGADPDERRTLRLGADGKAEVHSVLGTRQLDGKTVGLFRSIFPADRLPDLPEHLRRSRRITEALRRCGIDDYMRRSTSVFARAATPDEAPHLGCRVGEPLLHAQSVDVDRDGIPIEMGSVWFLGYAIQFVLEHEDGSA